MVQPGASPGQRAYCPVSGVAFDVKDKSAHRDLDGRKLYFCCEACAVYFTENRERVVAARERALRRQGLPNRALSGGSLDEHARAEPAALKFLHAAAVRLAWSGRGTHRALRVARTIADLAGRERVDAADVAEAVQYRRVLGVG